MLHVLPEPAATIVAAASFTGARKGELRGFRWEDFDGEQIRISQSYWRNHVQEPKTRKSKAPVPVISQLAERLELHRELSGNPEVGLMFPSPLGTPINVDALADGCHSACVRKGWIGLARLACFPAWSGNESSSPWRSGRDDSTHSPPFDGGGHPELLHQNCAR